MKSFTPAVPTQAVYRTLLQAMAHPCRAYDFKVPAFDSALLALAETLLDHEVSFCIHPDAPSAWQENIFTATKAVPAAWEDADYVFIHGSHSAGACANVKRGTPCFPDQSATLIYVVDQPLDSVGPVIAGPGLKAPCPPACNPFSPEEWQSLKMINSDYPLGADAIVLFGNGTVCALPRSTRIQSPAPTP